jgi:hypothetical protein
MVLLPRDFQDDLGSIFTSVAGLRQKYGQSLLELVSQLVL